MLKLDLERGQRQRLVTSIFAGLCFVLAQIAIFHWLATPWPFILGLLYLAQLSAYLAQDNALRMAAQTRVQWRETLMTRFAMQAYHVGERDDFDTDADFWNEMGERADNDLEHADALRSTTASLYGETKTRGWLSFIGLLVSHAIGIAAAWFIAKLW